MTKRTKVVALVCAVAVVAAAAALWWVREAGRERPAARLVPGVYALQYDFELVVPSRNGPAKATTSVAGRLEVAPSGEWLAVRGSIGHVAMNEVAARLTDLPAKGAEQELGAPWLFRYADDGSMTKLLFADGVSSGARAMLSAIAAGSQLVRPAGADATRWSANEFDLNGRYRADYVALDDDAVQKNWRIGAPAAVDEAEQQGEMSGEAKVRFVVDDEELRSVEMEQHGTALAGRGTNGERATFKVTMRLDRTGDLEDGAWASAVKPDTLETFNPSKVKIAMPRAPQTRPFDELLAAVRGVPEKQSIEQHAPMREELTGAIAQDATAPEKVEALLRKGGLNQQAEKLLIEGLVGARTPQAQASVAELLGDRKMARETQIGLLQASTLMSEPNEAFVESLTLLMREHADRGYAAQVAMTLGATTAHLENEPKRTKEIVQALVADATGVLAPPQKPGPNGPPQGAPVGVRIDWVLALGNTGAPEARDLIVATLLTDADELVRAAAAEALRFLDPVTVSADMDRAMATDSSIHVRYALTQAARWMKPGAMESFVKKALLFDASEYVRLGAAFTMATWMGDAPALRTVLADALAQEKSPKVAESLRNYLQPGRIGEGVTKTPFKVTP